MHQCQTRQGLKLLRQDNMEFWFIVLVLLITYSPVATFFMDLT